MLVVVVVGHGRAGSARIPGHPLRAQQRVDAGGLVEALIPQEAQVRGEFQIYPSGDFLAQDLLVLVEGLEHRLLVSPAKRHHVGGGKLQVRRHAHFGNGDDVLRQHVILEVAAGEHLGERMAHELGHALLALGGSGGLFETFSHSHPPGLDRILQKGHGREKVPAMMIEVEVS
jgi:hypothetical protein